MRIFVEVSSPQVEMELKILNHTLLQILGVLKAEPQDFSTEDKAVREMTTQVHEAQSHLPPEQ